jgi:hypothetical protein
MKTLCVNEYKDCFIPDDRPECYRYCRFFAYIKQTYDDYAEMLNATTIKFPYKLEFRNK